MGFSITVCICITVTIITALLCIYGYVMNDTIRECKNNLLKYQKDYWGIADDFRSYKVKVRNSICKFNDTYKHIKLCFLDEDDDEDYAFDITDLNKK